MLRFLACRFALTRNSVQGMHSRSPEETVLMHEKRRYLFTSESVTEGHPDKIADQVSDAVLDAVLAKDAMGRVACETALTTGTALVFGEITTDCYVDIA